MLSPPSARGYDTIRRRVAGPVLSHFLQSSLHPQHTPTTHSDIQLLPDVLHALFVFKIVSLWTLLLSLLLLFIEQTGICVRGCNVTLLQDRVSRQTCCGLLRSWVMDPFHLFLPYHHLPFTLTKAAWSLNTSQSHIRYNSANKNNAERYFL